MAVLERCRLVVGADTGPLHLAVALGVPVVGLYGPDDPALHRSLRELSPDPLPAAGLQSLLQKSNLPGAVRLPAGHRDRKK